MRSPKKKPEANRRQVQSVSDGAKKGGDVDSATLQRLGKALGNQQLGAALSQGNEQRDRLLAHICQRLQIVQGTQNKERLAMGREREWFKQVAKGVDGYHLPDPTRWHECAQLYKQAAEALCTGNLGRGAQLLEKASAAEEAAFESVPKMVEVELDAHETAGGCPDEAFDINDEAGCSGRARPQELKLADKVLNIQDKMEPTPPMARPKAWWVAEKEEEEEEEEEEDDA